jgi:hypothetical protein
VPNTAERAAGPCSRSGADQNVHPPIGGREAIGVLRSDGGTEHAVLLGGGPAAGTVRPEPGVPGTDETTPGTDSTRTVRTRPRRDGPDTGGAPVPG